MIHLISLGRNLQKAGKKQFSFEAQRKNNLCQLYDISYTGNFVANLYSIASESSAASTFTRSRLSSYNFKLHTLQNTSPKSLIMFK